MSKRAHASYDNTSASGGSLDENAREHVVALLRARGVRRAGIFGSMARNTGHADSDLDLLIEPPESLSLFGLSALALALEDLLKRPVDLVTYSSLNPRLHASVYQAYDELYADMDQRPTGA